MEWKKGDEKRKMKKTLRRMRPRIMKISSVESLKKKRRNIKMEWKKGDEKRKMKKTLRRGMKPQIMKISSVESLKSTINIQSSVENQKGAFAVQRLW